MGPHQGRTPLDGRGERQRIDAELGDAMARRIPAREQQALEARAPHDVERDPAQRFPELLARGRRRRIERPFGGMDHRALPLREPSILKAAFERRQSYAGPLEPTRVNLDLVERLGGERVREAVAMPLLVGGEVRYLLYADNAPLGRPLGTLDSLESAAARAARIIEKTLAARVAKPRAPGI